MVVAAGVGHLVGAGPVLLALPVAFAAGLLSFFSPCCLPLLPGYFGYLGALAGAETGEVDPPPTPPVSPVTAAPDRTAAPRLAAPGAVLVDDYIQLRNSPPRSRSRRHVTAAVSLFVAGFAAVFVSYGALFGGIGFRLQQHQIVVNRVLGSLTILLGVLFSGLLLRLPLARVAARSWRLSYRPAWGVSAAPVLGALFAVGWTPCIGPTLAAVLLLGSQTGTAGRGALLAFTYALGLGVPFIAGAAALEKTLRVVAFARRHAAAVTRGGALFLIAIGVLELTGGWADLVARLQTLIGGTTLPL